MGVKNKYFEAKTYYYKVLSLCILVVVDILFNSFTQFINFGVKIQGTDCQLDVNNKKIKFHLKNQSS